MTGAPALRGVVLAGGRSRRMGEDKGRMIISGVTQAERIAALLAPLCQDVVVSVRREQAALAPYGGMPLVFDEPSVAGPAAGLLAAWAGRPDAALLVVAVDMAQVDVGVLDELVAGRASAQLATAYRHPDGTLEPLCAIWEPAARQAIAAGGAPGAGVSLRRVLEASPIRVLEPSDPARLVSVNTPAELAGLRSPAAAD